MRTLLVVGLASIAVRDGKASTVLHVEALGNEYTLDDQRSAVLAVSRKGHWWNPYPIVIDPVLPLLPFQNHEEATAPGAASQMATGVEVEPDPGLGPHLLPAPAGVNPRPPQLVRPQPVLTDENSVVTGVRFHIFSVVGVHDPFQSSSINLYPNLDSWEISFDAGWAPQFDENELGVGEYETTRGEVWFPSPSLSIKHNGQELLEPAKPCLILEPWLCPGYGRPNLGPLDAPIARTTERFTILEMELDEHGKVLKFAADFERANAVGETFVSGQLRYNSNVPIPEPSTICLLLGSACLALTSRLPQ